MRAIFLIWIGFWLARLVGVRHPVGFVFALGTPLFAGGVVGVWLSRRLVISTLAGATVGVLLAGAALGIYLSSAMRTSPECTHTPLAGAGVGGQMSPLDAFEAYLVNFPPLAAVRADFTYERNGDEARFTAADITLVVSFDGESWRATEVVAC